MKFSFALLLLLASCEPRPEGFAPVTVDVPVPVVCHAPAISAPAELVGALPKNAPLADGMKACLEQNVLEQAYAAQLAAALEACR